MYTLTSLKMLGSNWDGIKEKTMLVTSVENPVKSFIRLILSDLLIMHYFM